MFAMLAGTLPASPVEGDDPLAAAIRLQVEAGLEPITDAGRLTGLGPASRWRTLGAAVDRAACATIVGPWTMALGSGADAPPSTLVLAAAEQTRSELLELQAAGCPMVRIDEPAFVSFPDRDAASRTATEAHRRLVDGLGLHAMLAITGGDATGLGATALFDLPYHSYLFDLIRGPESWRLVAEAPGDRGIVCGVVATDSQEVETELMVWAAHYAASTQHRGMERVGLATAGDLGGLDWATAARRVRRLGQASALVSDGSPDRLAAELDPRAMSSKGAALGRLDPSRRRDGGGAPGR